MYKRKYSQSVADMYWEIAMVAIHHKIYYTRISSNMYRIVYHISLVSHRIYVSKVHRSTYDFISSKTASVIYEQPLKVVMNQLYA